MSNGVVPSYPHSILKSAMEADGPNGAVLQHRRATPVRTVAGQVPGPDSPLAARALYWGCFYVSYRVVFSTFFIAGFVPGGNAFTHGVTDGARAACEAIMRIRLAKFSR
jgi:hypothetical protein